MRYSGSERVKKDNVSRWLSRSSCHSRRSRWHSLRRGDSHGAPFVVRRSATNFVAFGCSPTYVCSQMCLLSAHSLLRLAFSCVLSYLDVHQSDSICILIRVLSYVHVLSYMSSPGCGSKWCLLACNGATPAGKSWSENYNKKCLEFQTIVTCDLHQLP